MKGILISCKIDKSGWKPGYFFPPLDNCKNDCLFTKVRNINGIWSSGVFETSKWSSTIDRWGSEPETQDKDVDPKCRPENHKDSDWSNRNRWSHCRAIRGKATFEEPWPWREPALEKGIEGAKEGEEENRLWWHLRATEKELPEEANIAKGN